MDIDKMLKLSLETIETRDKYIEVLKNQIISLENDIVILEDRVTTLLTTPQKPVECEHKFVTIEWGQLRSVEKCSKCGKMQYGRGNY